MTAHALLQVARRRRAPRFVLTYLEDRAIAETLEALQPTPRSPVWPWVLLALAAGVIAGATLIPNAEPIAEQVADGGE